MMNKLMSLRFLTVLVLVFFIFGALPKAEAQSRDDLNETRSDSLKHDLKTLLEWFPGEYDNHRQVYQEAVQNLSKEKRHRQTHHIFFPVEFDFIPGKKLYAQQSQHYNLDDIYRQRIYAFEVDKEEQAIRLTIYTPKEPSKLRNAHLNPPVFQTLTEADFFLKPGCEVFWKLNGDQFEGYLKENACSYFSKRYNTQVFLNETLILRKDALLLDDTAVNSDGNLVFGVADKGPTINLKEKPCK